MNNNQKEILSVLELVPCFAGQANKQANDAWEKYWEGYLEKNKRDFCDNSALNKRKEDLLELCKNIEALKEKYGRKVYSAFFNLARHLGEVAWYKQHDIILKHFLDYTGQLLFENGPSSKGPSLLTLESIEDSRKLLDQSLKAVDRELYYGTRMSGGRSLAVLVGALFLAFIGFAVTGVAIGLCTGGVAAIPVAVAASFSLAGQSSGMGCLAWVGASAGFTAGLLSGYDYFKRKDIEAQKEPQATGPVFKSLEESLEEGVAYQPLTP